MNGTEIKSPMDVAVFPVIEVFGPTIQGEGGMIGRLTHFLRMGGCGHRCNWCDTMFAVDPRQVMENRTMMTADHIQAALLDCGDAPWVTISGGDPCIHKNLGGVVQAIKEHFMVAVETQGAIWQDWLMDVDLITLSPKGPTSGMQDKLGDFIMILDNLAAIPFDDRPDIVLKVVVDPDNEDDFQFALERIQDMVDAGLEHESMYFQVCSPVLPSETEHKVLEILRRYRMLCDRVFAALKNRELPIMDVGVLPQMHALVWPDIEQGV